MIAVDTQIAVVALPPILNGLFAISETALVSSPEARPKQRTEDGDRCAALELPDEPTRSLSTVQIGISPVGVLAFRGAALAEPLGRGHRRGTAARPLRGTHLVRRRGNHLPLPGYRGADAEAPRPERPRSRLLPHGRPHAFPVGSAISRAVRLLAASTGAVGTRYRRAPVRVR